MKKQITWESYEDAKKRIEAEQSKKKETKKAAVKKTVKRSARGK